MLVAIVAITAIVAVTRLHGWQPNRAADAGVKPVAVRPAPIASRSAFRQRPPARSAHLDDPAHWQQDRQAAQRESQRKAKSQHLALQARFAAEHVDPGWAAAQHSTLLEASGAGQIAGLHAQPEHFDVDCKSTTCRVEADFFRHSAAQDWLTLFLMNAGASMYKETYAYSTNPDGTSRVTIYGVGGTR